MPFPFPGFRAKSSGRVYEIDLSAANVIGQIKEMIISGNIVTTGDVVCDKVTGDVDIGGNLGIPGNATKLSATTVTGEITIAGRIWQYDSLEATRRSHHRRVLRGATRVGGPSFA